MGGCPRGLAHPLDLGWGARPRLLGIGGEGVGKRVPIWAGPGYKIITKIETK